MQRPPEADGAAAIERAALAFDVVSCSETHCIGLTPDGRAFTWALTAAGNRFGQLCAPSAAAAPLQRERIFDPREVHVGQRVVAVGAGGGSSAGHTALVGEDGSLFMCGCDRWQQLGLSSLKSSIGSSAAGYTWDGGKIWQGEPQRVAALGSAKIAQVARASEAQVICAGD
jgi:alpha-tubulin suppressor-like RCC1 family protein